MADPALDIVSGATGVSPVRAGDTITFQYPAGRAFASYAGMGPARLGIRSMQAQFVQEVDFRLEHSSSGITVTYTGTSPIPTNTPVSLELPIRDTSGVPEIYGQVVPDYLQPA